VLAAVAVLVGCTGGNDEDLGVLLDGAPAREVPIELEGIDDRTVLTSATLLPVASIQPESAAGTCLSERFAELEAEGSSVLRVGVTTESVTFREAPGQAVFACSNSPGPREKGRWCGGAYGNLYSGRLRDPRLSINCRTRGGTSVGFVWVEPGAGTQFVAVEQPNYVEVYEIAAGLPVRIATVSGVDIETSSATFSISEHDAEGKRLREYELEAFVAG
jgi:hypothetical protein